MGDLFTPRQEQEAVVHGSAWIGVALAIGLVLVGASAAIVWVDPLGTVPPAGGRVL